MFGIEQHAKKSLKTQNQESLKTQNQEGVEIARRQWRCHPGPKVCRRSCCGEHAGVGCFIGLVRGLANFDWLVAQPIWIGS